MNVLRVVVLCKACYSECTVFVLFCFWKIDMHIVLQICLFSQILAIELNSTRQKYFKSLQICRILETVI